MRAGNVLEVENLWVQYKGVKAPVIKDLSFSIEAEEILCLGGRSGAGKSTVVWALMEMLEEYHANARGRITLGEKQLLYDGTCYERRIFDWREIALVPQASMNSFHPLFSIGKTMQELLKVYEGRGKKQERKERILKLLEEVKLDSSVYEAYPHELSGGMKQRAAMAAALLFYPKVLILDEATTGLDVVIQAEVLGTILKMKEKEKMSILFISHDRELAESFCDRRIEL